jgi:RimJ/RimL family protein N-acetyltransferase
MTGHGLASARWGQRLTTEAFAMVLDLARALNLITVQTNIEQSNVASWRLWAAHDATLTPHENGRYTCEIQLASQGWRTGSVRGAVG